MEQNELPDNLRSIRRTNTYTVPAHYFDELADEIVSQVHLPVLASMPLSAPPPTYFDGLAETILSKINSSSSQSEVQKELEDIDHSFALIPKTNVYYVPQGYFNNFRVVAPSAAPVIKMHRPAKWIKYVAAALITGFIGTGIAFFAGNNGSSINSARYSQAMTKISDNDISDYLNKNSSDADFTLASPDDGNKVTTSEGLYKLLLNDVSDNEIQDYLNANDDSDEKNITGI